MGEQLFRINATWTGPQHTSSWTEIVEARDATDAFSHARRSCQPGTFTGCEISIEPLPSPTDKEK